MANYKDIKYQFPTSAVTSGTFANARISSGSVTQHVTATDLTPVRQDVLTLALKQAVEENHTKYNLPNSSIVKFEADADFNLAGSTDIGRNDSEYISSTTISSTTSNFAPPLRQLTTRTGALQTSSWTGGGVTNDSLRDGAATYAGVGVDYGWDLSSDWRFRGWITDSGNNGNASQDDYIGASVLITTDTSKAAGTTPTDLWHSSIGTGSFYNMPNTSWTDRLDRTYGTAIDSDSLTDHAGTGDADRSIDLNSAGGCVHHYWNNGTNYGGWDITHTSSTNTITMKIFTGSSFTSLSTDGEITITEVPSTGRAYISFGDAGGSTNYFASTYNGGNVATDYSNAIASTTTINATGTALGTTNVPTSPVTDVSGVMLLKDAYGSTTLGTDVKVYFTADNSAWTEATSYADAGTFSTGIKMIKLGKATCTSGSDVRWKIVWANQVASSKEAQIYGIGLNY